MRILLLTQVLVYPADAGPKIKTLQVLGHLAAHHQVFYCTYIRSHKEVQYAEELRRQLGCEISTVLLKRSRISDIRFFLESLVTGDSFLLRRDDRAAMQATVRQLLLDKQINVLHVDQLNMMRFVPPDWPGIVILDEHNAVWQVVERLRQGTHNPFKRWLLGREVRLIRKIEGQACQHAHIVLTVSEQDKQALQEVANPISSHASPQELFDSSSCRNPIYRVHCSSNSILIQIVPITIDTASFEPIWQARNSQISALAPKGGTSFSSSVVEISPMHAFGGSATLRLLTVGTMFWPPNSEGVMWWLREGYQALHALEPNVSYDIIGARPPRALQALAKRYPNVHLYGYIADVTPFWINATALLVPLLSGGGVRVKILEAMAMGLPVISTSIGCEGLAVRHGEHLLIADTPQAMVNACLMLIRNPELAHHLAQNARKLILTQYDRNVALCALDQAYATIDRRTRSHLP